jgi:hypothetical protein
VGRPRESLSAASEGLDLARRYGAEHTTLVANQIEAFVAIGEWDEADRASAAALRAVTPSWSHVRYLDRAALEIGRGDFDDARSHLETARARVAPALSHGDEGYDLLDAELALWERRWTDAEAIVRRGLARAGSRDAAYIRAQLAAQALRAQAELAAIARAGRNGDDLRELLGRAQKQLDVARCAAEEAVDVTPYAAAWRAQAECEYERARGTPRPDVWLEAATTWDRLERPPLAAYCHWRQADALVSAGASRTDASVPLRAAYDIATRLRARPLLQELGLLAERAWLDMTAPVADPRQPGSR